jgi:beta-N-acetylhexosaminidase
VRNLPLGPVMVDLAAFELSEHERARLLHPNVGGVILFGRNYRDKAQLRTLCQQIHALRTPRLLIAIDHEGGRVQRCRDGFTRIPSMRLLGQWWDRDPVAACDGARAIGFVLASDLRECDVDFSFTPVLDLDWGESGVIGDRAFHANPDAVIALAGALIAGMKVAGMGNCGKHFPGHGWVKADSHLALPEDDRSRAELEEDMRPFRQLPLGAVMPAHVIYKKVDFRTAGFSPVWHAILRDELGFDGVVFSDDLSMEGASIAGDISARASAAWEAGCDVLLVCNSPEAADHLLATWRPEFDPARSRRLEQLLPTMDAYAAKENPALIQMYQAGLSAINALAASCAA